MKFKIFHATNTRDSFFYSRRSDLYNQDSVRANVDKYVLAGEVDVEYLDEAYTRSQNLIEPWGDGTQRSTSVGDVLVDENGVAHVVASIGFDKIEDWPL